MEDLNAHFARNPVIKAVAERVKMSEKVLMGVFIGISFLLSTFYSIGSIVVFFNGVFYPFFITVNAMFNQEGEEDKQWLAYWMFFAAGCFIDACLGKLIYYIPFYYTIRLAFLVYLYFPLTRGGMVLYEKLITPLVSQTSESFPRRSKD